MQANQSVLEEEDEEEDREEIDLEAGGHATRSVSRQSTNSKGKKSRVSWRGDSSEMNVLRPNIRQEDQKHEHESSDDEPPQNFMIETPVSGSGTHKSGTDGSSADKGKARDNRRQPLYSMARKQTTTPAPVLPTSSNNVSIPPRPSELDVDDKRQPDSPSQPMTEHRPKQMRGLDDYERALWNWVNVYNLDAFLQEAYYYYEGKGIFSIALSRGLNLLLVIIQSWIYFVLSTSR